MQLFVKDLPVRILDATKLDKHQHYDIVVDTEKEGFPYEYLIDHVLVKNSSAELITKFYRKYSDKKNKKIHAITFLTHDYEKTVTEFKSFFKVLKAAGGLVQRKGEVLMIFRMGTWDLPKGKIDKGESSEEGALREVEEECNIKVELEAKLCKTWHTYVRGGKHYLKKTSWYVMNCTDDSNMKPQEEEDILEVRWIPIPELRKYLFESYRSIRTVVRHYRDYLAAQKNLKKV